MSKYYQLFSPTTSLVTKHGNNSPEIGYPLNKYTLVTHGCCLSPDTIQVVKTVIQALKTSLLSMKIT